MAQVDPQKILLIHFGQLGDVVLGLPAIRAVREHFPKANLTVLSGRSTTGLLKLANVADDLIAVDRVALRDGNPLKSIAEILRFVREIRAYDFDLVIDLHSLYETNLLGYLSGAKQRLFANRDRRSIDRLSNYPIKPPREDRSLHHTDRYLAVIEALGIGDADRRVTLDPGPEAQRAADDVLKDLDLEQRPLLGLFLGAGHHTRRWPIENFAAVARDLSSDFRVLVLLGPEERELRRELHNTFTSGRVVPELPLDVFVAVLSRLAVLVSGDTGPMHLGAAAGAGIVLLSRKGAPNIFHPLTRRLAVLDHCDLADIRVAEVVNSVRDLAGTR